MDEGPLFKEELMFREVPQVCPECGAQLGITKIGTARCYDCSLRRYMATVLERESEAWASGRFADVELSRERNRLRHIVLKSDHALTCCGIRATESRKKRIRVNPGSLPGEIFTDCVASYQQMRERARVIAQGVST